MPERPLVVLERLARARHEQREDLPVVERDGCQVREIGADDLVIVELLVGPVPLLGLFVRRRRQRVLEVVIGSGEPFERALDVAELELLVVLSCAAEGDDVG